MRRLGKQLKKNFDGGCDLFSPAFADKRFPNIPDCHKHRTHNWLAEEQRKYNFD